MLLLSGFVCPAQDASLPSWNSAAEEAWWAQNPTQDSWPKAADALQAQLEADYQKNGPSVFSDPDFQGWLDHLEWVRLGITNPDALSNEDYFKAYVVLGHDDAISHLFVEKLDPLDDQKQALENLLKLSEVSLADLHEYAALGVAYSVVFDQPFPSDWPHSQVPPGATPIGDLDIVKRFRFYVQSNRDKKLDLDPTRLSVENLKYLVDSEVDLSELAYAQQNRIPYTDFGNAFFAIKYDYGRGSMEGYIWPNPTYTLADIEKDGGICIDQAYYAETLGKGRGIPTIRFTGYGIDGAHAWFGYLTDSGKWELDCGRYENQSFPKGYAVDPQTWRPIDDSTLENLFKNGAQNPNYQPEMTALAWARLHQSDPTAYAHILDDARSIMPEWSGTWRMQAKLVELSGDTDKTKAFYQDWITQFANYPEMKVEGQAGLYNALSAAGNDSDADDLLQEIILQNRSEGFDIGIKASAAVILQKLDAQDWDDARLDFEKAIRDFGDQGGLTLFRNVVEPYISRLLKADRLDQAEDGIKFTEDRMAIDRSSQMGHFFLDLKGEVEEQKMKEQP